MKISDVLSKNMAVTLLISVDVYKNKISAESWFVLFRKKV